MTKNPTFTFLMNFTSYLYKNVSVLRGQWKIEFDRLEMSFLKGFLPTV